MTRKRVVGSALWAAWGDALGFMTELADTELVRQRTGSERVTNTTQWRRRVGGRSGPTVKMPAGCYSDDTQLRLATARAIGLNGSFDVTAFSKVELPTFLAYGLGVGRGTRSAAKNLGKSSVSWNSNFYSSGATQYMQSGGNGAAMRVQPHVWASGDRENFESWLGQVLRNVVTTHGHPRAIAGAVFHAATVALAIKEGTPPDPAQWRKIAEWLPNVAEVIRHDDDLALLWLSQWERVGAADLGQAMRVASDECLETIATVSTMCDSPATAWHELVDAVGGFDPSTRGSGIVTSVLAACLAHRGVADPVQALVTAANALQSDTDTIATMAGALLGAAVSDDLPGPLLDQDFISDVATWLESRSRGTEVGRFKYPDLLHWTIPRSQVDLVGLADGALALAGLGRLHLSGNEYPAGGSGDAVFQWATLEFGQTVLVRRRFDPVELPVTPQAPSREANVAPDQSLRLFEDRPRQNQPRSEPAGLTEVQTSAPVTDGLTLQVAIDLVVGSGFPEDLIGRCLLDLARQRDGLDKAAAFVAAVAAAYRVGPGKT